MVFDIGRCGLPLLVCDKLEGANRIAWWNIILNGLLILGYLGGKLTYHYRVGVRSQENLQRLSHPEDHKVLSQDKF